MLTDVWGLLDINLTRVPLNWWSGLGNLKMHVVYKNEGFPEGIGARLTIVGQSLEHWETFHNKLYRNDISTTFVGTLFTK